VVSSPIYAFVVGRARRRGGETGELEARRRAHRLLWVEHVGFVVLVGTGLALLALSGARLAQLRWLSLKFGIVLFLLAPLEAMHAYVAQAWIAPGLRQTPAPPFAKALARGIAVQRMILTVGAPLLAIALPLLVWLSVARPR
jgi:hypothetical protein